MAFLRQVNHGLRFGFWLASEAPLSTIHCPNLLSSYSSEPLYSNQTIPGVDCNASGVLLLACHLHIDKNLWRTPRIHAFNLKCKHPHDNFYLATTGSLTYEYCPRCMMIDHHLDHHH